MKSPGARWLLLSFCIVWAAVQLFPLVWMYYNSMKTEEEIMTDVLALPRHPQFSNWATVWVGSWGDLRIGRYTMNSTFVSAMSVILVLCLACPAGYALARHRFVLNEPVFITLLGTMCIPIATILIPLYILLKAMGLTERHAGLIFPYIAFSLPFATVLSRAYFSSYPSQIEDAARIDGCSDFGVFFRIVAPSSKIILVTLIVVVFPSVWNEYILANVVAASNLKKTLPVGIGAFKGAFTTRWDYMYAAISIASIPTLLVYFLFQRYIVTGMTLGAIKE